MAVDPSQVESLVGMGFAEAQVRAALEATNGNPDAAYALLESGVPVRNCVRLVLLSLLDRHRAVLQIMLTPPNSFHT